MTWHAVVCPSLQTDSTKNKHTMDCGEESDTFVVGFTARVINTEMSRSKKDYASSVLLPLITQEFAPSLGTITVKLYQYKYSNSNSICTVDTTIYLYR